MKSCLGENMIFLFGENVTFLTFLLHLTIKKHVFAFERVWVGSPQDHMALKMVFLYPMVRLSKMIVSGWESVHWWKGFACLLRSQATSKNSFTKNYKTLNGLCVQTIIPFLYKLYNKMHLERGQGKQREVDSLISKRDFNKYLS